MQVDVLILTFNRKEMVQRAIRSVLNSEKTGIEVQVTVIDDGSTDGTEQALHHLGGLIRYEKLEKNVGVGEASQIALNMTQAEFFVRLDSDDYLSRHFLSTCVPILDWNSDIDFVSCDFMAVDAYENQIGRIDLSGEEQLLDYGAGMVFRTELVKSAGGYTKGLRHREDFDLHSRLRKLNAVRYHMPVPLYRRRLHEGNISAEPEHNIEKLRLEKR